MLIVNSRQLPNNPPKDSELYEYSKQYQEKLKELQTRFKSGNIALRRNGYPKVNRGPDGNITLPEIPAPIFINYTKADSEGVVWGYCKGRPLIHANGLVEVPPNDNSEMISEEVWNIPLKTKPDYAFFIMYKSGLLGTEYQVYDPEGDKTDELIKKNARIKVQSKIWEMSVEKLRLMSQAWGIKNAGSKAELLLREELENLVFSKEEEKKANPTNLMAKGVDAFLAEYADDETTRPRAIVQYGFDEKRLVYNPSDNSLYFDSEKICFVPYTEKDRQDYLLKYFQRPENEEKWVGYLKGIVTPEYLNGLDKYGKRWLATQVGIATNKKEEVILEALLAAFSPQ